MLYKHTLSASPDVSRGVDPRTFFSNLSSANSLMHMSVSSWASVTGQAAHSRGQPTCSQFFSPCFAAVPQISALKQLALGTSLYSYGSPQASGIHATLPHIEVMGQRRISLLMPLSQDSILRCPSWLTNCWFEHLGISWVKPRTSPFTQKAGRDLRKRQATSGGRWQV